MIYRFCFLKYSSSGEAITAPKSKFWLRWIFYDSKDFLGEKLLYEPVCPSLTQSLSAVVTAFLFWPNNCLSFWLYFGLYRFLDNMSSSLIFLIVCLSLSLFVIYFDPVENLSLFLCKCNHADFYLSWQLGMELVYFEGKV